MGKGKDVAAAVAFAEGFHDLPTERERNKMRPLQLAELMATRDKDSPSYILLSHELQLKIAKVQAKATLQSSGVAAVASIVATLIAFGLGYLVGK